MDQSTVRLWFVSDIHASNACFRKFVNLTANANAPNVLIIGGDITGKHLVPIVERGPNVYSVEADGATRTITGQDLPQVRSQLENSGCYVYECDAVGFQQISLSKPTYQKIFDRLAKERLREWVALADAKLPPSDQCQVFINAGNDDPFFVDDILDSSSRMIRPEGKVIDLPVGMKLISTGYSNESPWDCPRDVTEEELLQKILAMTEPFNEAQMKRAIFNLHCPPKNTHLDVATRINPTTLQKAVGLKGPATAHVGSEIVRTVIEKFQPAASLHGHIHTSAGEDRIGRTICINPGSDYASGTLQGAFLVFNERAELVYHRLTDEREALPRANIRLGILERVLEAISPQFRQLLARRERDAQAANSESASKPTGPK